MSSESESGLDDQVAPRGKTIRHIRSTVDSSNSGCQSILSQRVAGGDAQGMCCSESYNESSRTNFRGTFTDFQLLETTTKRIPQYVTGKHQYLIF